MIASSVGGHHDQASAIFEVDKGAGMRFTASSPCGGQEQVQASDDPRADQSSRVTVDELMELEVRILQRGRGGVAHDSHSPSLSAITFSPSVATHDRRALLGPDVSAQQRGL